MVTGVAGFLGSHLAEKLAEMNYKVVGVDNMSGGYKDNIPKNIEEFEKYGNNTNVVTYFNKLSSWSVEYSYDNNYIKFQDYNFHNYVA